MAKNGHNIQMIIDDVIPAVVNDLLVFVTTCFLHLKHRTSVDLKPRTKLQLALLFCRLAQRDSVALRLDSDRKDINL